MKFSSNTEVQVAVRAYKESTLGTVYLADFAHPVVCYSPSKNMRHVLFSYVQSCMFKAWKRPPKFTPTIVFFSILTIMNKYFNIKPLACDHISTGNFEIELPLIVGCFIIFCMG